MNQTKALLVAIAVSCTVTLAATYAFVSSRQQAAFRGSQQRLQEDWEAEKRQLEEALRLARITPAAAEKGSASKDIHLTGKRSPQQILDKLKTLKPSSGVKRTESVRQVIYHLESLVELGPEALPAIREFLARFEDVEYSAEAMLDSDDDAVERQERLDREDRLDRAPLRAGPSWQRRQQTVRMDFTIPPSLRLGLVDAVKEIGGEAAEKVLTEMLDATGRGVEVAYVARVLQEMAPGKYREAGVSAAKDLLSNPVSIERPNRLDENAKSYLYGVLAMYMDTSFTEKAQTLLIDNDGRVDRNALNYLATTLKDQAIPILYQTYRDPRITDFWDKAAIASPVLTYAGSNPQANRVLSEIVIDETLPPWMRVMTIQSLSGRSFLGESVPIDQNQIRARVNLLANITGIQDERIARVRNETIERLNNRLAGKRDDRPEVRVLRRFGRPRVPGSEPAVGFDEGGFPLSP